MTKIFSSHNHRDKEFVRELAGYLRQYGIEAWVDEAEIKIGDSLIEKVGEAIKENAFVGVVISKNSTNSVWVQKELQIALQREITENRKVVLPILLDQTELPIFLTDKLYADFSSPEKYHAQLGGLLDGLGSKQRPGQRVYVSYTHDLPEHKKWVAELVRQLVLDGKNVTYDYSFMQPGQDFWNGIFHELARTNSVLLIITERYRETALGARQGGLKREYDEIVRLASSRSDMSVIPILWEGDFRTIPPEFSSCFAIDMRELLAGDNAYQQLLQALA